MTEVSPIHPKYWKKEQKLFDKNGIQYVILDACEKAGVFYATLSRIDIAKSFFVVYDSHDYTGKGPDPLPKYYRKKPKRGRKI